MAASMINTGSNLITNLVRNSCSWRLDDALGKQCNGLRGSRYEAVLPRGMRNRASMWFSQSVREEVKTAQRS